MADALALLADRGPAHLVGHSFGGTAALRLALEAPERVASLTLIEPTYFAFLAERDPRRLRRRGGGAGRLPRHRRGAATGRRRAARSSPAGARPAGSRRCRRGSATTCCRGCATSSTASRRSCGRKACGCTRPTSARVACPVLLIEGAASPPAVAAILDVIADALPGASRVRVPGAGHMLPVTHAAEVSGALRDFLALEHA